MQRIEHRLLLACSKVSRCRLRSARTWCADDGFSANLRHAHTVRVRAIVVWRSRHYVHGQRIFYPAAVRRWHPPDGPRPIKRIIFHFQVKTRCDTAVLASGCRHAFSEIGQAVGCGYFFRVHQRHVLKVVRQSRVGVRIFQRTHRHNQRGERFHRLRIGNQQHGHPVIKTNRLILTGVLIALTDCFL